LIAPIRAQAKQSNWQMYEIQIRFKCHDDPTSLLLKNARTHTHARTHARTHAHTHAHTRTHTHTHTHTHAHTHTHTYWFTAHTEVLDRNPTKEVPS